MNVQDEKIRMRNRMLRNYIEKYVFGWKYVLPFTFVSLLRIVRGFIHANPQDFLSSFKTLSEKFQIWIFPISLGVVPIIVSGSRVCGIIIICVSASSNPVRIFMVITSSISCINLSSWLHEIYEYTITVMLNLFDIV